MRLKEITEEMADLKADMLSMKDNLETQSRSAFTIEEMTRFDELKTKYENLEAEKETLSRFQTFEKPQGNLRSHSYTPRKADVGSAFRAWLANGTPIQNDKFIQAADQLGFRYSNTSQEFKKREQTVADVAEGGYLVDTTVANRVVQAVENSWDWHNLVTIHRTSGTGAFFIPYFDDTANSAALKAENTAISNTGITFNRVQLDSYKVSSGVYPVSHEWIEDTSFDVLGLVTDALGKRLGRKVRSYLTSGTGTSQPGGFETSSTAVDAVSVLEPRDFTRLYTSLKSEYRNSPSCVWMMNSHTYATVLNVEDTEGHLIFSPGPAGGIAGSIYGKPVVVNDDCEDAIYFGDFSSLHVRISRDINVQASSHIYFLEDAVALLATIRMDSAVVDPGSHPILHISLTGGSGA